MNTYICDFPPFFHYIFKYYSGVCICMCVQMHTHGSQSRVSTVHFYHPPPLRQGLSLNLELPLFWLTQQAPSTLLSPPPHPPSDRVRGLNMAAGIQTHPLTYHLCVALETKPRQGLSGANFITELYSAIHCRKTTMFVLQRFPSLIANL